MSRSGQWPAAARDANVSQPPPARGNAVLRAVMFDMDGLFVDSEPLWFRAENVVMEQLGGQWSEADQHVLVGGSMDATVDYLLGKAARPADPADVARWLVAAMVTLLRSEPLPVLPGVVELLGQVEEADLPHALVTSSEPEIVEAVFARLPGRGFPVIVCAADVARAKPDPEGYLLAAEKLGVDPASCIALEDSPNGVAAAEAAGYHAVAVPSMVPIPARPGRVVLDSLAGLTLGELAARSGLALRSG